MWYQNVVSQEGYRQLEGREEAMKSLLQVGEDIIGHSSEENTIELKERMEQLSTQLQTVRIKADKQKVSEWFIFFHSQSLHTHTHWCSDITSYQLVPQFYPIRCSLLWINYFSRQEEGQCYFSSKCNFLNSHNRNNCSCSCKDRAFPSTCFVPEELFLSECFCSRVAYCCHLHVSRIPQEVVKFVIDLSVCLSVAAARNRRTYWKRARFPRYADVPQRLGQQCRKAAGGVQISQQTSWTGYTADSRLPGETGKFQQTFSFFLNFFWG